FPKGRSGTLTITIQPKGEDEVDLVVADDGVGIPEDLDWRNTDTMGLMIAVSLVQQIDGAIELDRSRGTCWTIPFKREST
ncbi:MAG: histidine kinase, partial [Gammaproteobacteria bacterium]|nr:histidine kinase [Gammaproteobacteria bacterium]